MKDSLLEQNRCLDIDYLRSFGVDPAYFGLGFIQLKLTLPQRIHFYHRDLSATVGDEEVHDHRYDFNSTVLKGKFLQTIYEFDEYDHNVLQFRHEPAKNKFEKKVVSCDPEHPAPPSSSLGNLRKLYSAEYNTGSKYWINRDSLHKVQGDHAITLLTGLNRGETDKDYATVVRQVGAAEVCPFKSDFTVNQCWALIEDMLGDDKVEEPVEVKMFKPGYHLSDIPKGEIGEPTKILEEALELIDAHNQGVKIMQLVELSDLYGATARYMEKYHPYTSMQDIIDMHLVTRRAFDNGHR